MVTGNIFIQEYENALIVSDTKYGVQEPKQQQNGTKRKAPCSAVSWSSFQVVRMRSGLSEHWQLRKESYVSCFLCTNAVAFMDGGTCKKSGDGLN